MMVPIGSPRTATRDVPGDESIDQLHALNQPGTHQHLHHDGLERKARKVVLWSSVAVICEII